MIDFIIAGAGKSGTRTLLHHLSKHSELNMAKIAEPKYFTAVKKNELYSNDGNWDKGKQWYQSLFEDNSNLKGECSVMYFTAPDSPKLIYQECPKVKLIFVLRNPIDRFYSHYWQERKTGSIKDISIQEMFESHHPRLKRYFQHSAYKDNISGFLQYFPKHNIKIIIAEEFYQDSLKVINSLFSFLNISKVENLTDVIKNKAALPKSRKADKLIRSFRKLNKSIGAFIPDMVINSAKTMVSAIQRRNMSTLGYEEMPGQIRKKLIDKFEDDVSFVESFLNRDVPLWDMSKKT